MTTHRVVDNTEIRVGVEVVSVVDDATDEVTISSIDIMSGDPLAIFNEYTRWNPACLSSCERVNLEQRARDKAIETALANEMQNECFRAHFLRKSDFGKRLEEKLSTLRSMTDEEKADELILWVNSEVSHA